MTDHRALRRRFALRMALLVAVWLGVVAVARGASVDGAFGALVVALAWAIPVALPLVGWLDWRWLVKQEDAA